MLLILFVLILTTPLIILLIRKKYKILAWAGLCELLFFIWLAHPVCQVTVTDYDIKVITLTNPADIVRYFKAKNGRMDLNGQGAYCKNWLGRQMFF